MKEQQVVNKLNGLNVDRLGDTIGVIQESPTIAKFKFRAQNKWIDGGHNRTTIKDFYGAGQEDTSRTEPFIFDADEPDVLLGENQGANPVEYALTGLASCMMTALVYHATAQGIQLDEVEAKLEGDLDVQGFLGLDESVRNGYENVCVSFKVKGDASEERLEELVQIAQQRSPVFDIFTNSVPISVQYEKEEE